MSNLIVGISWGTPGTIGSITPNTGAFTSVTTALLFPPSDSTTALQIDKADGTTNVVNIDTTNSRVGIGTTGPSSILHVNNPSGSGTFTVSGSTNAQMTVSGSTSSGRLGQDVNGVFFASDTNGKGFRILTNNGALNQWLNVSSAGTVGFGTSATALQINANGNITQYSAVATVKGGVPAIVAAPALLTLQSAAIAATTAYAIPVAEAGMYRITYVATITRVATTSSILGGAAGFQIKFTNANGDAVVKTSNPTTPATSSVNATGTTISGAVTGYAAASTNLQYLFDYTSVGVTAMQYDLAIYVEYLG